MTEISPLIKQRMREQNVNISELAAKTGMSISLLSRMLRNDEHNYTLKTLQRIATALDLDLKIDLRDVRLGVLTTSIGSIISPTIRVSGGSITGSSGSITGSLPKEFYETFSSEMRR